MKKIVFALLIMTLLLALYIKKEEVLSFVLKKARGDEVATLNYSNDYSRNYKYNYVSLTNDFSAKDKTHLFNIYYTILNSGISEFTFYCNDTYKSCIEDVIYLADNQAIISVLNGFVHPFNSFSSIETIYDTLGRVTLRINKAYTNSEIIAINTKLNDIIDNHIAPKENQIELLREIHDYIINNSKYDIDKSDKNITKYKSSIAYGPLLEGYGICGGYTDSFAIILDRYNIQNMSVFSENHIWNALYIDGKWSHIDLTWDDPISDDGKDILDYSYFLISSNELLELEKIQHNFDQTIFTELGAVGKLSN